MGFYTLLLLPYGHVQSTFVPRRNLQLPHDFVLLILSLGCPDKTNRDFTIDCNRLPSYLLILNEVDVDVKPEAEAVRVREPWDVALNQKLTVLESGRIVTALTRVNPGSE